MADPTTPHKLHYEDGFGESWSRDQGARARVVYDCAWADRYTLVKQLIGGFGPSATGFGQWNPPHAFPPSPNLYALAITDIKGINAAKPGSKWTPHADARITVEYGVPTFPVTPTDERGRLDPSDRVIPGASIRVKAAASFRTLPEGKLKFSTSSKTVLADVGKPEGVSEISLTFQHVPFNPYSACLDYLGDVNDQPIFGHYRGEVLFDSIETDYKSDSDGGEDQTVTLNFLARVGHEQVGSSGDYVSVARSALDWNMLLNDDGDYEFIEFPSTGYRVFLYSDFWDLFT